MAYMSQERKKELSPKIKEICKKYGIKATLSTTRHSLVLNVKSGKIDFAADFKHDVHHYAVNTYWVNDNYSGKSKEFLNEVIDAMNVGNHDNSDIQSDYFDVGWYIDINVGRWNKPYMIEKEN